ncbi:MAG: DUF1552 domain-containing protein [Myxococcota bacterium]|nr:DUF1552 domain-containing protein [Myxococcota bacterium]MDW8364080.1 DUF1552 domain-containing protein [Myxococcales bacterium]
MITRRRFLVGLGGATVALPWLESLHGRSVRAGGRPRPVFVALVRSGNGVAQRIGGSSPEPEQFWPRETGMLTREVLAVTNADRATSELADYASRIVMIRGAHRPFGTPECGHAESIPQCLTAQRNTGGDGNAPLALGESIDWRIARELTPGTEPMTLMAGPRSAYIAEALSWRGPRERASAERSPRQMYMRLMGLSAAPPEVQRRIAERRASVNDLVREQMQALLARRELGSRDRQRLVQHFEAIRDTEVRTMACELDPAAATAVGAIEDVHGNDVRVEVVRRHMDVIALAASCRVRAVATLQIGEGNDQTQYEIDGSRLPRFHWISHRIYADGSEGEPIPDAVTLHHKVDRLQLRLFRYLLDRLDAYPSAHEEGRTLLDDSLAVWFNDLGNGPPHSGDNTPWILAGGAGGMLRTGRYIDLGGRTYNVVLNTILTLAGVRKADGSYVDDFGDPELRRGLVDEILAS